MAFLWTRFRGPLKAPENRTRTHQRDGYAKNGAALYRLNAVLQVDAAMTAKVGATPSRKHEKITLNIPTEQHCPENRAFPDPFISTLACATMATSIPCTFMRGGTSRGPYFLDEWLPPAGRARDDLLLAAMGSGHPLQVNGLGGGHTLTSKVAIVSKSMRVGCDIDYLFAQVSVDKDFVDYKPNCGNMLSGTVPFAIEQGIIQATPGTTTARVYNINTDSMIDVVVQTPGGKITYEGNAAIDGVPGTAAPVLLRFLDDTIKNVLPTGNPIDVINGVEVTCFAGAMAVMLVDAAALGVRGDESPETLDANRSMMARLEAIRRKAGLLMGLGDVSQLVVPKPALLSRGKEPNTITSRYFTPLACHTSHAVTGAVSVATAYCTAGTIAHRLSPGLGAGAHRLAVCHPAGKIELELDCVSENAVVSVRHVSLIRTARKIMAGELFIS